MASKRVPFLLAFFSGRLTRHLAAAFVLLLAAPTSVSATPHQALVLEVDGAIGPAVADYVTHELARVQPADTGVVVLRMDTPGGLDTSMREIIRAILASPVPVAAYVAPSGARAASAGTYITYACAVAAMAPGTNLGAATPVQMPTPLTPGSSPPQQPQGKAPQGKPGGHTSAKGKTATGTPTPPEPTDTESRKVLNDAVAYIRGLAELNGRNAEWAVAAVRGAVSLPATDALKMHVIDVIANDVPDLLRKIDGRTVKANGKEVRLETAGLKPVTIAPGWRTQVLAVITNPNIAYLLMLLGAYGLIFELTSPGAVLPGLVGTISLLTALFALNLLPIDFAGVALVLLGLGLMIAEGFIGAFGVLGVGGIVAFLFGSLIMFRGNAPGFGLSTSVVAAATIVSAAFFLLLVAMLLRSRRRPVVTGGEALIGAEGETVDWQGETGRVRVQGEIWQARCANPLRAGGRVRVVKRDGLFLEVEPKP